MAGEWIPIDCNLGMKPEVLAIAASTGVTQEVVIGRMVRLWAWAWHVTADGTIGVSLSMLPSVAGGDEAFWEAVQSAGWLEATDSTVTIPGWEERFSNAAKRRLLDARRKSVRRVSAECPHDKRTDCGRGADTLRTRGEERRGEEKKEEKEHTHTREAENDFPQRGGGWAAAEWDRFASRWNTTSRARPWTALVPPDGWVDYAARPGWLDKAAEALDRLPRCEFFEQPLAVTKFLDFVDRILAGEFDHAKSNGRPRRQLAKGRL